MSVKDLEKAVASLSAEDLSEFSAWFEEFLADAWDERFAQDVAAGKLDKIAKQADQDFEEGLCTPL